MGKSIKGFADLEEYGIIGLTGESDPYGLRMLCDLTDDGRELLREFFGFRKIVPEGNWNHRHNQTGSCVIPWGLLPDLAAWIFFHVEKAEVIMINDNDGSVSIIDPEYAKKYEKIDRKYGFRIRWNPNPKPGVNRNVHQFTGRTV